MRSVSANDIGPEGAKYFANALVVNRSLTSLEYAPSLNDCLHHLSAAADSSMLGSVRSVSQNDLTNGGKDVSGVIKLAEALKTNRCLQWLKCVPLDH